jgi:hypothetical protein
MADELRAEPRLRGGLARLLGAADGGRPALSAIVAGLAGAAAFVVSMVVDWQRVTVAPARGLGIDGGEYNFGLDAAEYAVAYVVGMLALLTMVGLGLTRPDFARRVRLGAVALGLGLVGVVVAIADNLRDVVLESFGYGMFLGMAEQFQELLDGTTYAPLPGQMLGFGAVALLVVAVWLAGGPAGAGPDARPAVAAVPGHPAADDPSAAPVSPADAPRADGVATDGFAGQPLDHLSPVARVGRVDDLTVTASDAVDLGGHDILRS